MTGPVLEGAAGIAGIVVVKPWGLTGALTYLGCIHTDDGQVVTHLLTRTAGKNKRDNQRQQEEEREWKPHNHLPQERNEKHR